MFICIIVSIELIILLCCQIIAIYILGGFDNFKKKKDNEHKEDI